MIALKSRVVLGIYKDLITFSVLFFSHYYPYKSILILVKLSKHLRDLNTVLTLYLDMNLRSSRVS